MGSVVSLTLGPPYAQGQLPQYPIKRRPGGPHYWYERFADQINFLRQPHIEIRLIGRAAHSQFCETDFEPDYSETLCCVSYVRRNFEPGSSGTLCYVSYVRRNFEPGSSESLCYVSFVRRNFEPGSSESLCSVSQSRCASPNIV